MRKEYVELTNGKLSHKKRSLVRRLQVAKQMGDLGTRIANIRRGNSKETGEDAKDIVTSMRSTLAAVKDRIPRGLWQVWDLYLEIAGKHPEETAHYQDLTAIKNLLLNDMKHPEDPHLACGGAIALTRIVPCLYGVSYQEWTKEG